MTAQPQTLKIRRPDDWHIHLRDDEMLSTVLPYTSEVFARAIVMPNLAQPITTVASAIAYRERILAAVPVGHKFTPLMTCYLTNSLDAKELTTGLSKAFLPRPNCIRPMPPPTPLTVYLTSRQFTRCLNKCKR